MRSRSPARDLHGLGRGAFREEVHSFEFWFQSVEGYLSGRPWGHGADTPESSFSEAERDRLITALCHYCVGETAALEGASGLIPFAPNRESKIFLATQVADEARHVEVLSRRLGELGVADPEREIEQRATRSLMTFRQNLLELVGQRDWEAALFAQNVMLEAMEFTTFQAHAQRADPMTREILEGIVKDERRHMGFGENELGRRLTGNPDLRARLVGIRKRLDPLILETFEETLTQLAWPPADRPELGRHYLAALARLGFGE